MIELPIDASLPEMIQSLETRSVVIVAPPGSGKTTRVPPAIVRSGLLTAENPVTLVLQPRRVAARSSAARIAQEQRWTLGSEVGYHVRFDRRFSSTTPLRFLTEGILTRQLLADPFLDSIGAVVLDEFHERNLHGDLALALLQEIRREVRPDLLLVVMSATLDAEPVARFLGDCPIIRSEGRSHEVNIEYRPSPRPAAVETLAPLIGDLLADPRETGHLLVFLPGMAEIRRLEQRIQGVAALAAARVYPLHGSLSADEQDRALAPGRQRKVILSTNVAETSLTIDGVSTVIDTGLARIVQYDAERGVDRWDLVRISRAAAAQRAGRAGRTGPGRCIRMWSEREHRGLAEFELPEIHRADLCSTVLTLHAWGINDPQKFGWYDPPAPERLAAAERLLQMLGGLEANPARITPLGAAMLELPVHPRIARVLIAAKHEGRERDGAAVAALLSEKDIKTRDNPPGHRSAHGRHPSGNLQSDLLDRLDMLADAEQSRFSPSLRSHGIDPTAARQVVFLRDELLGRVPGRSRQANHVAPETENDAAVLKWLLLAYPDRVVKQRGLERTGVMVGGRGVRLAPESVVDGAEFFLALDAREDRRAGPREVQVSLASALRLEWLETEFPAALRRVQVTRYDCDRQRVVAASELWYHDLLLREDASAAVDPNEAGRVLAAALRPRAAILIRSHPAVGGWLARLDFATRAMPERGWTVFDDDSLAEVLDAACQGKTTAAEVEQSDFLTFLAGRLAPGESRELAQVAPTSIIVPSGRQVAIVYETGRSPVLAVRLQELFGWTETPRLAHGRVPILLHLLAPNNRPVQITDDLRSFWTKTYQQVRKDLRGRYPKHAWPEDPFSARAAVKPKPK